MPAEPSISHQRHVAMFSALVVATLDLGSKAAVTRWIGPREGPGEWWLVDDVIGAQYGRNTGAAFGLFPGNASFLAAISVLVMAAICVFVWRELAGSLWRGVSVGLICGGAMGNLIERVRLGYVTDFVALGPWPRFNVADSAVTIGIGLVVLAVLTARDHAAGPNHDEGMQP